MPDTQPNSKPWLVPTIVAGLILVTTATFFGVWNNGFVDYDDNTYVFLNPYVARGFDWQTIPWAFTYVNACHWVPLTWISHALDCQFYGLNPSGHHVTNLLLHIANVILLFYALRLMTASVWRSAFVAALFAVHPAHVESVAWVAERKDVLSGFFFMLTLLAYGYYAKLKASSGGSPRPAPDSNSMPGNSESPGAKHEAESGSTIGPASPGFFADPALYYVLALLSFGLGLLSKSMLVTLPFLLVLLDFWPLGRLTIDAPNSWRQSLPALVREKWPFFALTVISCFVTFLAQDTLVASVSPMPLSHRAANALMAPMAYLKLTFWPVGLAVFYPPDPATLIASTTLLSVGLTLAATLVVLYFTRSRHYLSTGWFWYLGMLVPVCGIVPVGEMVRADRFTYLPSIGIFILLVWTVGMIACAGPAFRMVLKIAGVVTVGGLAFQGHRQMLVWKDTRTLFTHAAAVTRNNYVAMSTLASFELDQGRTSEALTNLEHVLRIAPKYPRGEYLMGAALQMQGRTQEALPHLEAAVGPEVSIPGKARRVLCLLDAGRLNEADGLLNELLASRPGDPNALLMKAALLNEQGRSDDARQVFTEVTSKLPVMQADNPTLNFEIAELYGLLGRTKEAVTYYDKTLEAAPEHLRGLNNLAWILATDPADTTRDGKRAIQLAERACGATHWDVPVFIGTLAAAYAEAGRWDQAVVTCQKARDKAQAAGLVEVAKRNSELLELYRQGNAYRETAR